MRLLIVTAVTAPLILSMSAPASAQSFLDGLARRTADRLTAAAAERVESAASGAMPGGADRGGDDRSDVPVGRAADTAAASEGPAPWPLNPDTVSYTGDLEFDPADEARAEGFHEFAKVRCMDCEGGYSFDSWITHHTGMDVDEVAARVGGLVVGEALTWNGIEASGRLEVVSETPVGPFACKQVRKVMVRGEATYETPGLYCFGKSHAYARAMWVEVL